jgi:hypothetical protein
MDPIGAVVAFVLAASAFYRTMLGKRESLTAGLWTAAFGLAISAPVVMVDAALESVTGLDSLSQLVCYCALVISSYLIARMTYCVAGIESHWPMVFTGASIAGMIGIYGATELHHTRSLAIEVVPGAASAWFAIFYALGLLPTHISAVIGVLRMKRKDSGMVWLLAIYGGVGAINPVLIVVDHIGTDTTRLSMSVIYPLVWVVQLVSFGALAFAGVLGVYRAKRDSRVPAELSGR